MLSTFDTAKPSGHDEISARKLKATALSMTPVVTKLLISLGALPDGWKIARISPVSKSSTRMDRTNVARSHFPLYTQQTIGETHEG